MRAKLFGYAIVVCSLGSCVSTTQPDEGVIVTPLKTSYVRGEILSAEMTNRSDETVGFGACSLRLEQRIGSGWMLVGPEAVPCIDIMYSIAPGGVTTRQLTIEKSFSAGTYRLRETIYPGARLPTRTIRSAEFAVRDAA